MARLDRLFQPKSLAVIGGGAWCASVIEQARKFGFQGVITPVHPKAKTVAGLPAVASLSDLPTAPDAAFVGVNRDITIEVVKELSSIRAGGAVCFASGFSEAAEELADGVDKQMALLNAADGMPILGPNCYGLLNAFDQVAIWPDQHGLKPVEKGVAILTQSSNIAINLTMHKRGLPIGYMVTCGNQAQQCQAAIAMDLLDDPRVTAIGLHIEGFSDLRAWEVFAQKAHQKSIPIVALKVGKSAAAQSATISHTASLAGSDAGAGALLRRLGIGRVDSLPAFMETLKLLHVEGQLANNRIASISCSGGEASLIADMAEDRNLIFPPLNDRQKTELAKALGPKVALANPLDYHTYIWRDAKAMTKAWSAMTDPSIGLTFSIVDCPRADICDATDWVCTTQAATQTRATTQRPFAVVAGLPELMPEDIAAELLSGGVIPMNGIDEALVAAEIASDLTPPVDAPLLLPTPSGSTRVLTEAEAKMQLSQSGLHAPKSIRTESTDGAAAAAKSFGFPVVLKGEGIAHKTETGAVKLNLRTKEDVLNAAKAMPTDTFLVEEMIDGDGVELLIGVVKDPAHGFVLTLAAGGILTELLEDSRSFLIPTPRETILDGLKQLRIHKLLTGYRGKPTADIDAILAAIDTLQRFVIENASRIEEIEINPLICTPTRAVVADALIREVTHGPD
jgi:acyl-CoA synthetase (NDP forming)